MNPPGVIPKRENVADDDHHHHHHQQQQQHQTTADAPPVMDEPKKTCVVCGDKALGYNFNAITCESCKAFFRRNALKKKVYKCRFTGDCDITVASRRYCQKCRLRKCFQVGMMPELITVHPGAQDDDPQEPIWPMSVIRKRFSHEPMFEHHMAKVRLMDRPMSAFFGHPLTPHDGSPSESYAGLATSMDLSDYNNLPSVATVYKDASVGTSENDPIDLLGSGGGGLHNEDDPIVPLPKSVLMRLLHLCHQREPEKPPPSASVPRAASADEYRRIGSTTDCTCRCTCRETKVGKSSPLRSIEETTVAKAAGVSSSSSMASAPTVDEPMTDESIQEHSPVEFEWRTKSEPESALHSIEAIETHEIRIGQMMGDEDGADRKLSSWTTQVFHDIDHVLNSDKRTNSPAGTLDLVPTGAVVEFPPDMDTWKLFRLEELLSANELLSAPRPNSEGPLISYMDSGHAADMMDIAIRRTLDMFKCVSAFSSLPTPDQMTLFKSGVRELNVLRGLMVYEEQVNCWRPVGYPHRYLRLHAMRREEDDGVQDLQRFYTSFDATWRKCDPLMLCLTCMAFFDPTRPNLIDINSVQFHHHFYRDLLKCYLRTMYSPLEANSVFETLLERLRVMKAHVTRFLPMTIHVEMNPRDLSPLLIDIIPHP